MGSEGQPKYSNGEQQKPIPSDEVYAGIAVGFLIHPSNKDVVRELQLDPLDFNLADKILDLMGNWEKPQDKTTELLRFEAFNHFDQILDEKMTNSNNSRNDKAPIRDLMNYLQKARSNTGSWEHLLEKLERESNYIPEHLRGRKMH